MNFISAIFTFLGKATGLWAQRDAEKNAADVKAAAVASQEQNCVDQSTQAVAKKDITEIQKELAE